MLGWNWGWAELTAASLWWCLRPGSPKQPPICTLPEDSLGRCPSQVGETGRPIPGLHAAHGSPAQAEGTQPDVLVPSPIHPKTIHLSELLCKLG